MNLEKIKQELTSNGKDPEKFNIIITENMSKVFPKTSEQIEKELMQQEIKELREVIDTMLNGGGTV